MRRREVEGDARFVTFSCEKRLPLLGNPRIRDVIVDRMFAARARFEFELFAWVVMPEHAHLVVRPRTGQSLDRALLWMKQSSAQRVIKRWKQLRAPILERIRRPDGSLRFWQKGGGFDRNIRSESVFCRDVQYIHRNPVKRGLAGSPEEWAWSSVHWWMSKCGGERACDPPPGQHADWDRWTGFM